MLLGVDLSYDNSLTIMILSLDKSKNISFSLYQFLGSDSPSLRDPGSKMPWSLSRAHVFKNNFKSNFKNNFKNMMWNNMEPIISELTQWSGSLTHLASDLGQVHQKYICTIPFQAAYLIHTYVCTYVCMYIGRFYVLQKSIHKRTNREQNMGQVTFNNFNIFS